jgi:hypothetical protein
MGETNYYPLIFRAVSRLARNTPEARREVYERARAALTANTNDKKESGALEWAIHVVEKSPHLVPGTRGSTSLLALSMLFPALWIQDATCTSLYWIARPWNKNLLERGGEREPLATAPPRSSSALQFHRSART